MKPRRIIPNDVLRVQVDASDPSASAWVSANAGCGKTHVLAQRVIRLMLAGTAPAKILCLTFTRAAAANMANQVFEALAKWITLDDAALARAVAQIEGRSPSAATFARARRLFSAALDAPGGLKVQTIHAFCARLLQQFPFEANVAARFSVLDERAERGLLERLRLEVLLRAAADPDSPIGVALSTAIASATDGNFRDAIDEAIARRGQLAAWLAEQGGLKGAVAELSALLGVDSNDDVDRLEVEILASPFLPVPEWPACAALLATGQRQDRVLSDRLSGALGLAGSARRHAYLQGFFTDRWEARRLLVTKAFAARHPALADRLVRERDRLQGLLRRRFGILARERTAALLTIASDLIDRYRREKEARGLLDYNDLIDKTLSLMTHVEAAWVHYKLDLGIDHVLVDEAQDTSPEQWEIIKKLVAEFTSGQGARGIRRTIFAVGDEKQSIFSFQGAAPHEFAASRRHFERAHRDARMAFVQREFKHSFRSGANVLSAIDTVFSPERIYASVTTDADGIPPHLALPGAPPGLVEIWPCIVAKRRGALEAWDAPFDELPEQSPQIRLAERIAEAAGAAVAAGRQPGDILVLVRQRGQLFEAILRALKNAGMAVSGADRLVMTEHIAVMDLLVLADALLLPSDDLALATVLKSPLFGFDEDLLFRLAFKRRGTLWAALLERAETDARCAGAAEKLERLAERSRNELPFHFYARLLGAERGRKQILGRLGQEADDVLDEFLNLALAYEAQGPACLQGFIEWMRASAAAVKRDMDVARNEVRVMTVHGAKGLEAPMVVLADTTTRPAGPRDPRLLPIAGVRNPVNGPRRLVWAGTRDQDVEAIARAREDIRREAEAEYRRLLYVAMTRTAEHLIICGAQGINGRPRGCWYDLVFEMLTPHAEKSERDGGIIWPWRPGVAPQGAALAVPRDDVNPIELPGWLQDDAILSPAPACIAPSRTASPQLVVPSSFAVPSSSAMAVGARAGAIRRGLIVHRLLQFLPEVPPERRDEAARRHLARHLSDVAEQERDELLSSVFALLDEPRFAALFGPGTRAEVPIVGRLARNGRPALRVSGQVDRLAVTDEFVLIADYKSDRPAPRQISEVPPAYILQLALYRAVLARIFPERPVRAGLLWIEVPDLMDLPQVVLDNAARDALANGS